MRVNQSDCKKKPGPSLDSVRSCDPPIKKIELQVLDLTEKYIRLKTKNFQFYKYRKKYLNIEQDILLHIFIAYFNGCVGRTILRLLSKPKETLLEQTQ
ncbi:hypothetical protein BpHYR1_007877 [Brachionus plicatilis]|uniref:Uncharacterized protein n=1 Tax=Brachionus plicatilis TaxID=10195 RepID=A0A3M7S5T3_BRAPC|nr:hypothetical protein BpHYR1_007877 [Brachionus plicatilis]